MHTLRKPRTAPGVIRSSGDGVSIEFTIGDVRVEVANAERCLIQLEFPTLPDEAQLESLPSLLGHAIGMLRRSPIVHGDAPLSSLNREDDERKGRAVYGSRQEKDAAVEEEDAARPEASASGRQKPERHALRSR